MYLDLFDVTAYSTNWSRTYVIVQMPKSRKSMSRSSCIAKSRQDLQHFCV